MEDRYARLRASGTGRGRRMRTLQILWIALLLAACGRPTTATTGAPEGPGGPIPVWRGERPLAGDCDLFELDVVTGTKKLVGYASLQTDDGRMALWNPRADEVGRLDEVEMHGGVVYRGTKEGQEVILLWRHLEDGPANGYHVEEYRDEDGDGVYEEFRVRVTRSLGAKEG